ncbi:endonuclease domain-containing protein [Novosphingobium resinovorum]|uniref:Recombination endonuclease VII n=1 Tax=Novosphingobium resinovorum TaxID=158500 RepID=A0A1D8A317_9SPHN|nr:hypothetical protein BES08_06990 [Novosphingobium resinovorum]
MTERQGNKCKICRVELTKFHIDHCHKTNKVRGLLCHRCNIRLAALDDAEWHASALQYLKDAAA